MKQRVGLARALCVSPDYLLMDEPFGALDQQTREMMQVELARLWESNPKTVIFVTHSIDEAVYLSDRVVVLSARPARVLQTIDIHLPRPRWTPDEGQRMAIEFAEYRQRIWRILRDQLQSPLGSMEATCR
jgi:NitT/TauT family transport system ATP-binding protein